MNSDTQFEWSDLELELMSMTPKDPPPHLETEISERFEIEDIIAFPQPVEPTAKADPQPAIASGVEKDFAAVTKPRAKRWPMVLAAAAALLAGIFVGLKSLSPENSPAVAMAPVTLNPVSTGNQLLAAYDGGIIMGEDQTPYRRVHFSFVDDVTWESTSGGTTVHVAVPREEVVLYPIETL